MDLVDLLDENGLQQDEWSLTSPSFGEEGQLGVIGHDGGSGQTKFYILLCSKCCLDKELFGGGYFRSLKSNLVKGQLPCGCSKKTQWSKIQFSILCTRKAKELGFSFLGFEADWRGNATKIKMLCEKHGEWSSGDVNNLINNMRGCPLCGDEATTTSKIKPDVTMTASFLRSGGFHPETRFWRSDKKNYWYVSCPECGETGESMSSHLQKGRRPCACNMHRQQEGYINFVIDIQGRLLAIKFGIANNSCERVKTQNRSSLYEVRQHLVYHFPEVASCKKAERDCKKELECGVLSKEEMPDGYTETTWVYNLEKVIEIYARNRGILK